MCRAAAKETQLCTKQIGPIDSSSIGHKVLTGRRAGKCCSTDYPPGRQLFRSGNYSIPRIIQLASIIILDLFGTAGAPKLSVNRLFSHKYFGSRSIEHQHEICLNISENTSYNAPFFRPQETSVETYTNTVIVPVQTFMVGFLSSPNHISTLSFRQRSAIESWSKWVPVVKPSSQPGYPATQ